MSIAHVTAPGRFGGAESVVAMLAAVAGSRGHRVRVIALHGVEPDDRCEPFQDLGEAVELIEVRLPARRYRSEAKRIAALLAEVPNTVAHTHGYRADVVGRWAARAAGCPLVSTVHGFTGGGLKNRVYEWLDRYALRRFDAVVAVSRPLVEVLRHDGIAIEKVHFVPNAWTETSPALSRPEARRWLGIPAHETVVGWIGRLTHEKGPDVFVEAIRLLPNDVVASVVGDGAMRESLERRVRELGLNGRVRWHGGVESAGRLLAAFDVVVLSSRTEGTPIVLLEAMAARVPVVATTVGGIPDVVSEAEAVLVPAEAPAALAHGVKEALRQPSERTDAAWSRLQTQFDPGQWVDRYESVYRSVSCRR